MNATYALELSLLRYDAVLQRGLATRSVFLLTSVLLIKRGTSAERNKRTARLSTGAEQNF